MTVIRRIPKFSELASSGSSDGHSTSAGCCPNVVTVSTDNMSVEVFIMRKWRISLTYNFVPKLFAQIFSHYGFFLAKYPVWFIFIPLLVGLVTSAGLYRLRMDSNAEYHFTPEDGRAKIDRGKIEVFDSMLKNSDIFKREGVELSHIGLDRSAMEAAAGLVQVRAPKRGENIGSTSDDLARQSHACRFAHVVMIAKPGVNLFNMTVYTDIHNLQKHLATFTVMNASGHHFDYHDLCMRNADGNCVISHQTGLSPMAIFIGHLTYPYYMSAFIGQLMGGVRTKNNTFNGEIEWISATQQYFCLYHEDPSLLTAWEVEFHRLLNSLENRYFSIYQYSSSIVEIEFNKITQELMPKFGMTIVALMFFSMTLCLMNDPVRSKPWLGLIGILSSSLAITSAFGLMGWMDIPFISLCTATPFLTLGIGIDDMFVLLAGWRRTDASATTEVRMRDTLEEAGTSILITSLINALSFVIGSYTPYPGIQIFSKFTAAAMFFDFFFQLSIYTAAMAITGKNEEENKHSLLPCLGVLEKKSDPNVYHKSTCYILCCTGGVSKAEHPSQDTWTARFFKDYFGPFILSKVMRFLIMAAFLGYLGISFYGATRIHEGLRMEHLTTDNSTSANYFINVRGYFRHFGHKVTVVFMKDHLNYVDPITQSSMLEVFHKLENARDDLFWGPEISEFWLRDYLVYLRDNGHFNMDYAGFVSVLRKQFLTDDRYTKYDADIRFDESGTRIMASRGIVVSRDLYDSNRERGMMVESRKVTDQHADLGCVAFNPEFIFFDQYTTVLPLTLYNVIIAMAAVLIASLFMIAHPVCIFWLALTIMSIIVGIFGMLTFWSVDLDSISMVCIIICVGYCVDYATHLMYCYTISILPTRREKAIEAISAMGFTVIQAGCATTISVLAMAASPAYIFRTFFKTLFICIILSSLHTMLLLPVMLSFFGPISHDRAAKPDPKKESQNGEAAASGSTSSGSLATTVTSAGIYPFEGSNKPLKSSSGIFYTSQPQHVQRQPSKPLKRQQSNGPRVTSTPSKGSFVRVLPPTHAQSQVELVRHDPTGSISHSPSINTVSSPDSFSGSRFVHSGTRNLLVSRNPTTSRNLSAYRGERTYSNRKPSFFV